MADFSGIITFLSIIFIPTTQPLGELTACGISEKNVLNKCIHNTCNNSFMWCHPSGWYIFHFVLTMCILFYNLCIMIPSHFYYYAIKKQVKCTVYVNVFDNKQPFWLNGGSATRYNLEYPSGELIFIQNCVKKATKQKNFKKVQDRHWSCRTKISPSDKKFLNATGENCWNKTRI